MKTRSVIRWYASASALALALTTVGASRNRKVGALAVTVVIALAAVALILGTRAGPNPTTPADERPAAAPDTSSGPVFLDLRTGVRTPLPETLVPEGAGAGNYVNYSASPDGTRLAYGTCLAGSCSGADVTEAVLMIRWSPLSGSGA